MSQIWDESSALPPANDFKSFSGSLRKYVTHFADYKLVKDPSNLWISVSNGVAYLTEIMSIFRHEELLSRFTIIKHSFDFRLAVKSAPTIYTISLTGRGKNTAENVVIGSIFKEDENGALQHPQAWNVFRKIYSVHGFNSIAHANSGTQDITIRHMICPDLAALRKTVNTSSIEQPMHYVLRLQQVALVLHTFFVEDRYLFSQMLRQEGTS